LTFFVDLLENAPYFYISSIRYPTHFVKNWRYTALCISPCGKCYHIPDYDWNWYDHPLPNYGIM